MSIAWFICPYVYHSSRRSRYCAMDNFTGMILADRGRWSETEILGDRAIVKVKASITTISTIAGGDGFKRLPKTSLSTSLSDLTKIQKDELRDEALDQGYTIDEIQTRFGNDLGKFTLGDVLQFMASRRHKARYDSQSNTIICDGIEQSCRSIYCVDAEVQ